MTGRTYQSFSLALLLLAACASAPMPDTGAAAGDAYRSAVADAAVIEVSEIAELRPVRGSTAVVVTWTPYPESYAQDRVRLAWGDVWVTLDGDVRSRCRGFGGKSVSEELLQLLGLPLKNEKRAFVTMEVSVDSLFRPCADPDITTSRCPSDFHAEVSPEHKTWFAQQTAGSYQMPGGYPWTRLGYTYNWKPGQNEIGVSEYVIRKGATVNVLSVTGTDEYCAP